MAELDPEGVDYAFDAVGAAATTKLALRWTRGGGTAVVVGLPAGGEKLELDPFEFSNREKTLTGTIYGSEDPGGRAAAAARPRRLRPARAREPRRAVVPARPRRRRVPGQPRGRARPRARHPVGSGRGLRRQHLGRRLGRAGRVRGGRGGSRLRRRAREAAAAAARCDALGRRLGARPGQQPGAVPLPPRRRGAPDRAPRNADAALAGGRARAQGGRGRPLPARPGGRAPDASTAPTRSPAT